MFVTAAAVDDCLSSRILMDMVRFWPKEREEAMSSSEMKGHCRVVPSSPKTHKNREKDERGKSRVRVSTRASNVMRAG